MESNSSKLNEKIINKFIELSSSSTSHGYPNIFRTKFWAVRIMWLIFFLISLGLCIFMIYRSINDFLSNDVVNKIRDYSEVPMVYPAITFCNINPLINNNSDSLISEFLPDSFEIDYLSEKYNFSSTFKSENITTTYMSLIMAKKQALNKAMDPSYGDENRKKLWYPLNEILVNCVYNGIKCNESDFTWFYMYDFGNCYQFNTGKDKNGKQVALKNIFMSGEKNGLYLEVYAGEGESIYSLLPDSGIVVFIHNQSFNPMPSEGIKLAQRTLTNIVLSKVITQREPYPYSECQDLNKFSFDKILYNAIIKSNSSYKQKLCFDLCLQQIIIKTCKCYDLEYLKLLDASPCLTLADISCTENEYLKFVSNDINSLCNRYCPLECDAQYFNFLISSSTFPSLNYANILGVNSAILSHSDGLTIDSLPDNVLAFSVYFQNLAYTSISESIKTSLFDLTANIGIDFSNLFAFFI